MSKISDENSRGQHIEMTPQFTRSIDDRERSVDVQGGRFIKQNYRSVEPSRYRDNHNQILSMVSNTGNGHDKRPHAVSQEPARNDLYSKHWEQVNGMGTFEEFTASSTKRKKRKIIVKKKEDSVIQGHSMENEKPSFIPTLGTENELPSARFKVTYKQSPNLDNGSDEGAYDPSESPKRKKIPKKLLRPKRMVKDDD